MRTNFLPSRNGFRFANKFADEPVLHVNIGGVSIPVGSAANGLCAGMVHAALDLFRVGRYPPPDSTPPRAGEALFDYVASRQMDTLDYTGKNQDEKLLNLATAGLGWLLNASKTPEERFREARTVAWPTIKAALDAGVPTPVVLLRGTSTAVTELQKNHVVLAYHYELSGNACIIKVYDPNYPKRDDIQLWFDTTPNAPAAVGSTIQTRPTFAFSLSQYTARTPPTMPEDKPPASLVVPMPGTFPRKAFWPTLLLSATVVGVAATIRGRRDRGETRRRE